MGRALGVRWAHAGHEVFFGSRDLSKAKAVAATDSGRAHAGDFQAAAAFGDVILYTVRDVMPSSVLRDVRALSGKIVIDCNNRDLGDDSRPADFNFDKPPPAISLAQRLAADVPDARIVKAFSTIPYAVIELGREQLAPHRVSVLIASKDARAKGVVKELAEELGFVGIDSGGLEHTKLIDAVADFLRLQIGPMGLGLFATISVNVLPKQS